MGILDQLVEKKYILIYCDSRIAQLEKEKENMLKITPCKYISQNCPNYSPDSHTCNRVGGPYCGKIREFEKNNQ